MLGGESLAGLRLESGHPGHFALTEGHDQAPAASVSTRPTPRRPLSPVSARQGSSGRTSTRHSHDESAFLTLRDVTNPAPHNSIGEFVTGQAGSLSIGLTWNVPRIYGPSYPKSSPTAAPQPVLSLPFANTHGISRVEPLSELTSSRDYHIVDGTVTVVVVILTLDGLTRCFRAQALLGPSYVQGQQCIDVHDTFLAQDNRYGASERSVQWR